MAQKISIENWRGQTEYVEIFRDDYSCRRRFKNREEDAEAEQYFNYLQSLDNQQKSLENQKEIAAQLKRQNELTEQKLNNSSATKSSVPFSINSSVSGQNLDPEYLEWLQFKKETDPKYVQWKKEKDAAIARESNEQTKRNAEIYKKYKIEEEERQKYKIDCYKKAFVKYKMVIETYEKWFKIIKKISDYVSIDELILELERNFRVEYTCFHNYSAIKSFISEDNYLNIQQMKKSYDYITVQDNNFTSVELEYDAWKRSIDDLISKHKFLKWKIGDPGNLDDKEDFENFGEGISACLKILIEYLIEIKGWQRWGIFGQEGRIRKKLKESWEKYNLVYTILEPYLNCWRNDMFLMFKDV